jgi:hypothetical protein
MSSQQQKKVLKRVSKRTTPKVEEVPEVTVAEVPETPVSEVPDVPDVPVETTLTEMDSVIQLVSSIKKSFKDLEVVLKGLRVSYVKESKKYRKKKRVSSSTRRNGFLGLTSISAGLSEFLEVSPDSQITRPDVTKAISKYIKENNLSVEGNKSIFVPDAKLKKLLGEPEFLIAKKSPEKGTGYTYFNLQSYLKKMKHFV